MQAQQSHPFRTIVFLIFHLQPAQHLQWSLKWTLGNTPEYGPWGATFQLLLWFQWHWTALKIQTWKCAAGNEWSTDSIYCKWSVLQYVANLVINVYLTIAQCQQTNSIIYNMLTALLFGNQPHSVAQIHHALHMHMHPYWSSPDGFDDSWHYSEPCDYCISISTNMLARNSIKAV